MRAHDTPGIACSAAVSRLPDRVQNVQRIVLPGIPDSRNRPHSPGGFSFTAKTARRPPELTGRTHFSGTLVPAFSRLPRLKRIQNVLHGCRRHLSNR